MDPAHPVIPRHARAILVVRLSARGDLVFASPLARALRRRFPEAHIAWAAEERTADVIRHNPHLDEVIVWERAAWKQMLRRRRLNALAKAAAEFVGALRRRRFDAVIDVQGLLRSGVLAFLTGAPVRIGLGSREGSRFLMTHLVKRGGESRKIASEYAYLASFLGLRTEPFPLDVPRSPTETAAALRLLAERGLGSSAAGPPATGSTAVAGDDLPPAFVAACPFTTRPHKHWFEDRWARLIQLLRARAGPTVVLLGGPGDRAAADRILTRARTLAPTPTAQPVVDLVGRTTLAEAAAVVSMCSVLVGVDTGLAHMAHAFDRPAVLLFGSNTPYLDPPSSLASILHSGRSCSPCRGKLVCDGRIDCMADLSVESVLKAVEARLGAAPKPPSPLPSRTAP